MPCPATDVTIELFPKLCAPNYMLDLKKDRTLVVNYEWSGGKERVEI